MGVHAARRRSCGASRRPAGHAPRRPSADARDDPRATRAGAGSTRRCTATTSTIWRSSSRGLTSSAVGVPPDADRADHPVAEPDHRGHRRGRDAARVPPPSARPCRRLHRRGRRGPAALHAVAPRRLPDPAHRLGEARLRSAVVTRRAPPRVRPRRGDLGRRGRRLARDPRRRQARRRARRRAGRPTAIASPSCRAAAAGRRSG